MGVGPREPVADVRRTAAVAARRWPHSWVWFGVLLLTPYDAGYRSNCEARLFTDRSTANEGGVHR